MLKFAIIARNLRPPVAQQARVSSICFKSTNSTAFRAFSADHGHGHNDHHDDHHDAHHDNDTFLDPKVTCERIIEVIGNFEQVTKQVTPTSRLREDLGLDSLDTIEIVIALEDEFVFEIPPSESEKFFAVPDIVDYISKHPMAKG